MLSSLLLLYTQDALKMQAMPLASPEAMGTTPLGKKGRFGSPVGKTKPHQCHLSFQSALAPDFQYSKLPFPQHSVPVSPFHPQLQQREAGWREIRARVRDEAEKAEFRLCIPRDRQTHMQTHTSPHSDKISTWTWS